MKIFDIAIKDMTRSFRSMFAVVFMFGVPLLMAGMFYLMFGGSGSNGAAFTVPVTKVVVANLDEGSPSFDQVKAQFPAGTQANTMGALVTSILQQEGFAKILDVTLVNSAETARSAVDTQKAGAAIIIPADFSAQFSDLSGKAVIELYKDPTLTIGPGILQSVLNQVMDSMSGAKIAVSVVTTQAGQSDPALIGQVVQQYMASSQSTGSGSALEIQEVASTKKQSNIIANVIGPIFGWLIVFYAFFTGASTAQSILREDEDGTLPRLFTTPTKHSTVLAGKFLAVGLTVVVQMVVLFTLGRLIFGIVWGTLASVAMVIFGVILCAATFGIFLNSLLKSTKQSGLIFGGLLTVLGMLGGIPIFMGAASASADTFSKVSLIEPIGWAVRGLLQMMSGTPLGDIALTSLVLVGWSIVFFVVGVLRFQKRYA